MNPKDLTRRREWLVWALALSRAQRRSRGIRAQKLDLIGELQAIEYVLRKLDTSTPGANDPVERGPWAVNVWYDHPMKKEKRWMTI